MGKILFISAFPPNQKTAGQDYTRRLIEDLLSKGHEISLIYAEYPNHLVELPSSVKILGKIQPAYKNCFSNVLFHPFFTKRLDKKIIKLLQSESKNFDILYFDFSQVHIYSLYVEHPRKIMMCHDVIAQKFTRKGRLQLPYIKLSERRLLNTAAEIYTFSNKDCDFIFKTYSISSKQVNFYLKTDKYNYSEKKLLERTFCFYGAWNRTENTEALIWFIKNVLPYLKKDYRYNVIGGGITDKMKSFIRNYENFTILGFVENPIDEIAKSQALIAPLHKGAGVKVKVIDALTSGTKVIGTDVAFEGIEDNKDYPLFFLSNNPNEYIQVLNNWKIEVKDIKQASADEFYSRYNTNHFSDLM